MTSEQQRPVILGLGGTPRPGSTSECAVRAALDAARAVGAETHMLNGRDLMLPAYDPSQAERTAQASRLIELLRTCDGVLIASPGYHGSVSGLLKNALDYVEDMRTDTRVYLEGRAVGCIVCAQGWQATGSTIAALRSIVHALRGWPTPLGVAINSAQRIFDGDGRCVDANVAQQLEMVAAQVVQFARMQRAITSA